MTAALWWKWSGLVAEATLDWGLTGARLSGV